MGCGASTATGKHEHQVKDTTGTSGTSRYAADDDGESYGEPQELTDEELRLLAELDHRSTCSTAVSAEEPSAFSANVRLQLKVIKARVLHGIDGSVDEASASTTSDAKADAKPESARYKYGDLKPRQVRKIADWAAKVTRANPEGYEPVPDRWVPRRDSGSSFSQSLSHKDSDMLSPRSVTSSMYPETPTRMMSGMTPRRDGSAANFDNMEVSGSQSDALSTMASPPGFLGESVVEDDDEAPTLDVTRLRRQQAIERRKEEIEEQRAAGMPAAHEE
mmetsp:Transcript_10981/g.33959  ORF Transcript_10981/g.33959 Transcript_10981/m.33959 type:complete len:276 (-) Transcript_10981:737-1564(-)